jgi:hypothetical protein
MKVVRGQKLVQFEGSIEDSKRAAIKVVQQEH